MDDAEKIYLFSKMPLALAKAGRDLATLRAVLARGDHCDMGAIGAGSSMLRDEEPITFKSLTASVASALQRDLVHARFMPGEKLPIVQLAKHYRVSPGAVREALSRLISEGLVEFTEQRGFRAASFSPNALADITRTRILIDQQALREAIRLGSVDWEAEVLAIHHRLASTSPRESENPKIVRDEFKRLHRIFHRTLISACASEWLMRFHDLLFDQTIRYRAVSFAYEMEREDLRRDSHAEHAAIVEASLARDADKAAKLIEQHYLGTAKLLAEGRNGSWSGQK